MRTEASILFQNVTEFMELNNDDKKSLFLKALFRYNGFVILM